MTFSGFSAVGDTWSGQATLDLVGPAKNCTDPAVPPTAEQLQYCYELVEGTAQWQYRSSQVTVNLTPTTDSGGITLIIKDPRPDRVRTYAASLAPQLGGHCIPGASGCRDAANFVIAWTSTSGLKDIGDRWQLVGTATLCAPEDPTACQGWTWDFQPMWRHSIARAATGTNTLRNCEATNTRS